MGKDPGSFTDDYTTGIYIGQVNAETGKKEGLGVRIYLTEPLGKDEEAVPHEKVIMVYEGCWQNDLREGKGFEVYSNKDIYSGFFH